jgi:hypothetical protein
MHFKQKRTRFLITLLSFFLFCFQTAPAIEVSGNVSGIWGPEDNPYLVIGNLRVPSQDSLIILPGCQIKFQGHYRFDIDSLAILKAIGTESDSIVFTNEDTLTGWYGLRFHFADSSCELAYCRLEWGRGTNQALNDSLANGGAIYCLGSGLSVHNSLLQFNRAWEGYGGAIYARQSDLSVSNCTVIKNRAGWGGSAIYATYCNVSITDNIISNDTTFYLLGGELGGGAIGCFYSNVEILANIITNNFCGMSGGGICAGYSYCLVAYNIINANGCWYYGAGICLSGLSRVINNLICNNINTVGSASAGGGIAYGDSVDLINNTIFNNYCDYLGGGVYCWGATPTDIFENNIIWGNSSYADSQIYIPNQSPVIVYNDVQGGWPGEGNIDANPLFAGPDDFHLTWLNYPFEDSTKSPCIDSGDPASPPDSDGSRADMGAYPFIRSDRVIGEDFLPGNFALLQNYPNPFNAQTTISYSLPQSGPVKLSIYNLLGQKVSTLLYASQTAGEHTLIWNASAFPSGIYFARLEMENNAKTIKLALLK